MEQMLQRGQVAIAFENGTFALKDVAAGLTYAQTALPEGYTVSDVQASADAITYVLHTPELTLDCTLGFNEEGQLQLKLHAPWDAPMTEAVKYPAAFDAVPGDVGLFPISGGYAFPVDDPEVRINPVRPLYHGWNSSMPFWAIQKGDRWLMIVADCGYDAECYHDRGEDGLLRTQLGWVPELKKWGYDRSLTFFMGGDGVTGVGKTYRAYAQKKGLVVPLAQKMKKKPQMAQFVGAVDFWLFNDHFLDGYRPEPLPERAPNPYNAVRVAEEMKAMGMDRVLWGFGNLISPEEVAHIRDDLGYLVGRYDNFRDVMPPALKAHTKENYGSLIGHDARWPEDIIIDKDGHYQECWEVRGDDGKMYPQHALCDAMGSRLAMQDIPDDVARKGYNARFVDTIFAIPLEECYNPRHPMSRSDCVKYRKTTMGFVSDLGLVCGVEDGMEDAVPVVDYSEGMMCNGYYRCEDCGRRMDTQYFGDKVEPQVMTFIMDCKYRVPLWELVYHDCMVSYWYWGESSNCCPEHMIRRDLLDNLYGAPPLYSVNMTQWDTMKDELLASYRRTVPVAAAVGFKPMTRFEYLSEDRLVQQSWFEDVSVIVNFSDAPFTLADGRVVMPLDRIVDGL